MCIADRKDRANGPEVELQRLRRGSARGFRHQTATLPVA
jgi:hypothetical protein